MIDFEHLVEVRFKPNDKIYSFRSSKGVKIGDSVFVKTWVNPNGAVVKVENTKPMDGKFKYAYALKVYNDKD
jgi:hypothetical protein